MKAHGHHAEKLERSALAVVAGEAAEDVAQEPGKHRAGEEKPDRPRKGAGNERRDRCGKGGEGRAEIEHEDPAPVGEVLIDEAALHSIEIPQRLTHPASTASGLVSPKAVIEAIICSTGSMGVRCVMKNVSDMPMKTTSTNCNSRLAMYSA